MQEIQALLHGFGVALTPTNVALMFTGVILGVIIGVLPGLGGANGVAILLPLTFGMAQTPGGATSAIILLSCIYWGALFGGAITSILFNIPGEPWSVATTFDGYPLAQQGRAGTAARDRHAVGIAPAQRAGERRAAQQRRQAQRVVRLQEHELRVVDQVEQGALFSILARLQRAPVHFHRACAEQRALEVAVEVVGGFRRPDQHDARLRAEQREQASHQLAAAVGRVDRAARDDQPAVAVGSESGWHAERPG